MLCENAISSEYEPFIKNISNRRTRTQNTYILMADAAHNDYQSLPYRCTARAARIISDSHLILAHSHMIKAYWRSMGWSRGKRTSGRSRQFSTGFSKNTTSRCLLWIHLVSIYGVTNRSKPIQEKTGINKQLNSLDGEASCFPSPICFFASSRTFSK